MTIDKLAPLDPLIHSQVRLAVLSILVSAVEVDFVELKEATGTTDGNLSTHLAKLEEAGYILVKKSFRGRKPATTCALTEAGRRASSRVGSWTAKPAILCPPMLRSQAAPANRPVPTAASG